MKISAKGRYALAAAVTLAQSHGGGGYTAVIGISEKLGISKIYLEQVFSMLRRGGVVVSAKGAQGGYRLARPPRETTLLQILSAVEPSLFEPAGETVADRAPDIEAAMRLCAFDKIDGALQSALGGVTLSDLVDEAGRRSPGGGLMYYI